VRLLGGRMCPMSKPYPKEFRDDVVRVARERGPGVSLAQIARDFGIAKSVLHRWMREADPASAGPGEGVELAQARQRIRLLEQENEVLRRAAAYLSQANLPKK